MAAQRSLRVCKTKPRVFIVSDISNEPDDAESLVRYLLYSNEFDTRGLVACTSTWMRTNVHPEDMQTIVKAYGQVVHNLNAHVHPENQYAAADYFLSIIKTGPSLYGKEALKDDVPLSDGAALLIQQVDQSTHPLWVLCWGGINLLAQALYHVQKEKSVADFGHFRSKLRVYTISDQDDTGIWIRINFPDIFYICSVHGWNEYGKATWTGISGDILHDLDRGGPDKRKITKEWLREHIQIGPLGKVYPSYAFIMEGDTPTFLYLIQNGLGHPEHPEWGSWGGRYTRVDLGGLANHYHDAIDEVIGVNGQKFRSNQATIWRWRDQYQNDFAARMQWTLTDARSKANHAPVAIVNTSTPGPEPLLLEVEAGTKVTLDASQSYDPDGDSLTFKWFQYREPTSSQSPIHWLVPDIELLPVGEDQKVVTITLPSPETSGVNIVTGKALEKGMVLHFILQVTDDGTPSLTAYKRVVVQITNKRLIGGREYVFETVTAALGKD
ncbi:uncharacterized protein A1O5_02022 [Cladophialophora psammophila CBS 110553]|uniref:Uncharacterized protein n=1 Tax=Cladophialophora psammophila CBS 110553 TaxID=1182543 RepID=W9XED8_9EURO|nr:uncharacterized protein A1O5_02022 [Cladophialophora psammophila CBS 110553]EXJ75326.1 hypothetical protein A1O5_02022 [Cladophialophora psammophila CBS 110553]